MFNHQGPISIASTQPSSSSATSNEAAAPPLKQSPIRVSYKHRTGFWKYFLILIAIAYVVASCYFMYFTYNVYEVRPRVDALEQRQKALEDQQAELSKRVHSRLSEFKQTLSSEVGTSTQAVTARVSELETQQKAAAARLAAAQSAQSKQSKQLAAVSDEVSNVKSAVGSTKADLQKTQTDLAATNAKLEHAMGDLGIQSGLIAHNAGELDQLRRKGERNYDDFTLQKGTRSRVANISLVLKKADPRKNTFTLNVLADDKTIEKKDRTLDEPLQFYVGPDHVLYELVVFTATKNSVTGYLSTPKNPKLQAEAK
jgi:cell division protein FtsL